MVTHMRAGAAGATTGREAEGETASAFVAGGASATSLP